MDWLEPVVLNDYSINSVLPHPPHGSLSGRSSEVIGFAWLQIGQSITGIFLLGISSIPSIL